MLEAVAAGWLLVVMLSLLLEGAGVRCGPKAAVVVRCWTTAVMLGRIDESSEA